MSRQPPAVAPSLLSRLRSALRLRHYSVRTVEAYAGWVRRFIRFHDTRHPDNLAEPDVTRFLSWLAEDGRVSAATQTQAASALVFLYREVLDRPHTPIGLIATDSFSGSWAYRRRAEIARHRLTRKCSRQAEGCSAPRGHGAPRAASGTKVCAGVEMMACS